MSVSEQLAWREAVRAAAHEAAMAETHAQPGDGVTFNYRWEHVQAVVRLALRLAELTGADAEIVEASAWLHDVAKSYSKDHGRDGAIAARQILGQADFPPRKIAAVADAIVKHVGLTTSGPVEPLEAAVLWDADKLSKLGATIVLHFTGWILMEGETTTASWLDRFRNVEWMEGTVRSFNTAPAQAAGHERLETFRAFYRAMTREFEGDDLVR
jgi:uncharacterized protein